MRASGQVLNLLSNMWTTPAARSEQANPLDQALALDARSSKKECIYRQQAHSSCQNYQSSHLINKYRDVRYVAPKKFAIWHKW